LLLISHNILCSSGLLQTSKLRTQISLAQSPLAHTLLHAHVPSFFSPPNYHLVSLSLRLHSCIPLHVTVGEGSRSVPLFSYVRRSSWGSIGSIEMVFPMVYLVENLLLSQPTFHTFIHWGGWFFNYQPLLINCIASAASYRKCGYFLLIIHQGNLGYFTHESPFVAPSLIPLVVSYLVILWLYPTVNCWHYLIKQLIHLHCFYFIAWQSSIMINYKLGETGVLQVVSN
jgi:hypothetical protein